MSAQSKTVNDKLNELGELVAWFQSGSFKLEEALDKYKQAEALAETIEKELTGLKNEIKVVSKRFDEAQ